MIPEIMLLPSLSHVPPIKKSVSHSFLTLSETQEKTLAVALASFAFLTLQFGLSSLTAGYYALSLAAVTLLSQETLRNGSTSLECKRWFDLSKLNTEDLKDFGIHVSVTALFTGIFFNAAKIGPIQEIGAFLASGNPYFFLLAIVIAPITEEILFRGFLRERVEDTLFLTNRYIFSVSASTQKKIAHIAQALLFGAVHLQFKSIQTDLFIFAITSNIGYKLMKIEDEAGTIYQSICTHSLVNAINTLRLLCFGA